jgi:hypothetical protein
MGRLEQQKDAVNKVLLKSHVHPSPPAEYKVYLITHVKQDASLTALAANKLTSTTVSVYIVIWLRISTHSTLSKLLINALKLV